MFFGLDFVIVLVIVLIVVLIWRGPKMLPKWGETLGRGVKATRKEVGDLQDEIRARDEGQAPPPAAPPPAAPPPAAPPPA